MAEILELTDPDTGRSWTVRLRKIGDKWGRGLALTHDKPPAIEFYDHGDRNDFPEMFAEANGGELWGQYAASYYVDTIVADPDRHTTGGLALHLGMPMWRISPQGMTMVVDWLIGLGEV